jgi:hypothetical protein
MKSTSANTPSKAHRQAGLEMPPPTRLRSAVLISAWSTFAVFAACGGAKRVPGGVLEKLPYESRIELLEAENDLALAVDHLEEARNETARTRTAIRRAKERKSGASKEEDQAKDNPSRDVAHLTVQEAEARVDYLRAREKVNESEEKIQDVSLRCALARFEVARVNIARKAKVKGSEDLDPKAFENQVKNCEKDVADLRNDNKERLQKLTAAREAWDRERTTLAKKTFDARASPYVE